jgi:tetratricopeptide (TPR) repeat protein
MKKLLLGACCALALLAAAPATAQPTPDTTSTTAALLEQGSQLIGTRQFARAIEVYSRVLASEPRNVEATYNRAVCWLATGESDKALAGLTETIAMAPDYPVAYLNRGTIHANRKSFADAASDFTRVITLDSLNISAFFMRGQVFLQSGRIPEAVHDLRNALAMEGETERGAKIARLLGAVGFAPASGASATFRDDEAKIALELPKEWHRLSTDDGKTLNMFVSEQKVEGDSSMFMVGATIHRIRRMTKTFPDAKSDGAWLAGFWSGTLEEAGKKLTSYQVLSTENVTVGSYSGIIRLVELQQNPTAYRVRMYEVVLGGDDEVVTVNLEAPELLFADYNPTFRKALATLAITP